MYGQSCRFKDIASMSQVMQKLRRSRARHSSVVNVGLEIVSRLQKVINSKHNVGEYNLHCHIIWYKMLPREYYISFIMGFLQGDKNVKPSPCFWKSHKALETANHFVIRWCARRRTCPSCKTECRPRLDFPSSCLGDVTTIKVQTPKKARWKR
jgi:hypothetical protein